MSLLVRRLAIDLGTNTTRVYVRNKGVAVQEPSLVARNPENDKIIGFGLAAEAALGRETEQVEVISPLRSGVIADFSSTELMLRYFINKATGRWHIGQPEAMITVPGSATSTEQRAVVDVGKRAGLKNVYLIPSGVAAALGAGLPIIEPSGHMIIDIGSGTTELAVMSLGGTVSARSIRIGGQTINESLIRGLKREYGLHVGQNRAEEIKRLVASLDRKYKRSIKVSGRSSLKKNQVETMKLNSRQVRSYITPPLERVVVAARGVLERTPPDLVSDIAESGITLSGGGAYLDGLADYLSDRLNVTVKLAQDPLLCSVKGAFIALTHIEDYRRSLLGL